MSERPTFPGLFALGIITACTLAFQVVLSRFFSAAMAYHFSFLAISLSLLGTGSGALIVYLCRNSFMRSTPHRVLLRICASLSLSLIVVPIGLVQLDYTQTGSMDPGFAINLTACCLFSAIPCLLSGMAVAFFIDTYQRQIGVVYAYDLIGAALGAVLIVPLMFLLDAPSLMACLGILTALATLLFAGSSRRGRVLSIALLSLGFGIIGLSRVTSILYLPHNYELPKNVVTVAEYWSPLARVFGFRIPGNDRIALLFYDRVYAPVPIVKGDDVPGWDELITGPGSIGYELTGPGRALIIGGGGGRDIYTALSSGQHPIDVIELIESNRKVVDQDLGFLSGSPYTREGVHSVIGDGRSVLARRNTKYNQIYLGFTDTLSANAAQGFSLSENNLYTLEAFDEYFRHLLPYGILNISRPLKLVGDEALRMTVLALQSLKRQKVEDPLKNVVVVLGKEGLGPIIGTILARIEPFTEKELQRIEGLAEQRGMGLAYAPNGVYQDQWKELAQATSIDNFCNSYHLNVCPPTDDKPFFFTMQRISQLGQKLLGYHYSVAPYTILMLTLVIMLFLSLGALIVPLFIIKIDQAPSLSSVGFFAAIGLGFMLMEMVLIQRLVLFLGFPTYALSVVLFALLIFSGVGSFLSTRFKNERYALLGGLSLLCLLILISAFGMQQLLRDLIHFAFSVRVAISIAIIAPIGITAGMAMPLGLKRFVTQYPRAIAYAWSVNGVTSVLASVLGVAIAINSGFTVTSLLAALCYGYALIYSVLGR